MKIGIAVTVLLFVLAAAATGFAVAQIPQLGDVVLEETRTRVPGSRIVRLDGRRYNIFYEAAGDVDRSNDLPTPRLDISVQRADGDGRRLPLRDYDGSFTTSTSNRESTAILTVEIPREGAYRIEVRGGNPAAGFHTPTLSLGEPIGRRVIRMVAGVILTLVFIIAGMLVLIFTVIQRSTKKD